MSGVPQIEVEQLRDKLQSKTPPLLLDVREPREYQICRIPGSQLLPLATLPAHFETLSKDQEIVIHCHHGGRSARAVSFLLEQGFSKVFNLAGGIHAWSERIDQSVKTYQ